MSGHKHATVSISPEDYQQLKEAELKLRFSQDGLADVANQLTHQVETNLERYYDSLHARQQEYLDSLHGVSQDILDLEQKTSQGLLDHQAHLLSIIQQQGNAWEQLQAALDEQNQAHQQQIEALHRQSQDELNQLNQILLENKENERKKKNATEQMTQASLALAHFISEHYDLTDIPPNMLKQCEKRIALAQSSLEQGMFEASFTAAQQAFFQLSELRLKLENIHGRRQLLSQTVYARLQQLLHQIQQSLNVPAVDMAGKALYFSIDVDYWMDGELSHLENHLLEWTQYLEENSQSVPPSLLHELNEHLITDWEAKIHELIHDARVKAINSQLRVNIADIAVRALFKQGYSLQNASYSQQDMRGGFRAILCNLEGSEVIVQIDPQATGIGQNELHLFASDRIEKTAHESRQRSQEIARAIQQAGLQISHLTAMPDHPRPVTTGSNVHRMVQRNQEVMR